jgi:alpha-tubulin suppressor-like RCC1 family protein
MLCTLHDNLHLSFIIYHFLLCVYFIIIFAQALQKCDRFIEALDNLLIAEALAPEDPTIHAEMQQLQEHISTHVMPLGVGCTFSWGLGSTGALGHPESKDKSVPTSIAALARRHVVDVSCGAMHSGG